MTVGSPSPVDRAGRGGLLYQQLPGKGGDKSYGCVRFYGLVEGLRTETVYHPPFC